MKIHQPMCYQCRARSNWITAYHSSMLLLAGAKFRPAIILPSAIAMTSFIAMFIFACQLAISGYSRKSSNPIALPLISLFLFLNLSGFGFVQKFYAKNQDDKEIDFVYNIGSSRTTTWLHPLLHYILPYRSSPFILHISVSILFLLLNQNRRKSRQFSIHSEMEKENSLSPVAYSQSDTTSDDDYIFENFLYGNDSIQSNKKSDDQYEHTNPSKNSRFNEYAAIGILMALLIPLQHQAFFSIEIYFLSYLLIEFLQKAFSKTIIQTPIIFKTFHDLISSMKSFIITIFHFLISDFFGYFFSNSMQKLIIGFFFVAIIPVLQYRVTGMDISWIHREKFWDHLIEQGYIFPSIVLWFQNLGLFPLFCIVLIWPLLKSDQIKFLLPTIPVFIFGNYFSFQVSLQNNFLFLYPSWALINCIYIPIALKRLTNLRFITDEEDEAKVKETLEDDSTNRKIITDHPNNITHRTEQNNIMNTTAKYENTILKHNQNTNEEIQGFFLALSILFIASCTISSILGLYNQWNHEIQFWDQSVFELVQYIEENISSDAIFITSNNIINPIPIFTGRISYTSSPRTLYLHDYIWFLQEDDLKKFMTSPDLDILPQVQYYVEFNRGDNGRKFDHKKMENSWTLCFQHEYIKLYNRTSVEM